MPGNNRSPRCPPGDWHPIRFRASPAGGPWGLVMGAEPDSLLVVDDEELNREGLARRLQKHGYAVTLAASGREAVELLGDRRFDLVLLDIMMPGMTGLDVLKFLR